MRSTTADLTNPATLTGAPLSALPFVRLRRGAAPDYWHVPSTDDYAGACEKGREYAAWLAQYLKNNPSSALFTYVIGAMNHADKSPAAGYRVGFLAHWSGLATRDTADVEVFANLYRENERHRSIAASRAVEDEACA